MINDKMKIIAEQQSQRVVLKGNTIKYNNQINLQDRNEETLSGNIKVACKNNVITINGNTNGDSYANYQIEYYGNSPLIVGHKFLISFRQFGGSGTKPYLVVSNPYAEISNDTLWTCESTGHLILRIRNDNRQYNNYKVEPILVDLTLLGLDTITTLADFYATDLGKFILNGNYLPYSATNTIYSVKSPFTFKKEIEYNNLSYISSFSNSQVDERANDNFNFAIYDFANNYTLDGKTITENGKLELIFTCNITSNNIAFYHSGTSINIYFLENISLISGHKYIILFNVISHDSRVVGGLHLENIMLIDLTQLGLGYISNVADFYKTELGQAIRNGTWLPYSLANTKGNAITPTTYIRTKRVDLGTLNWTVSSDNRAYTLGLQNIIKNPSGNGVLFSGNCMRYSKDTYYTYQDRPTSNDKYMAVSSAGIIGIRDTEFIESGTTSQQLKQALSGVILEYETAEPLELNGIGTNYDTFENHSGKVIRKIKRVKINDLDLTKSGSNFNVTLTDIKSHSHLVSVPQILCSDYNVVSAAEITLAPKAIAQNRQILTIKDSDYSSVSALKSAKGNVDIYYILETQTTENERSVLVDHRYNKVVDSNGNEIDTD